MWVGLFIMGAWAFSIPEAEPENTETPDVQAVEVGMLHVVAVVGQDHSWVQAKWEQAVRKAERQWRRASRRADEPLSPPELPEPTDAGVAGVTIIVTGASSEETLQGTTNKDGLAAFKVAPGLYRVQISPPDGPSVEHTGVLIHADRTTKIVVPVELWLDTEVITMRSEGSDAPVAWSRSRPALKSALKAPHI